MRILLISTEYPTHGGHGGVGSYVGTMAPALAASGHEIHVLTCASGSVNSDKVIDGVNVHERPLPRLRGLDRVVPPIIGLRVRLAWAAWRFVRRSPQPPDICETADWMAEGLLIAMFSRIPLVVHLHTPHSVLQKHAGDHADVADRLADRLERLQTRLAAGVTCPARLLASDLQQSGWLAKSQDVAIIRYPVKMQPWGGVPAISPCTPLLVAVIGRIEARKAAEVAIAACARLRSEGLDVTVRLIGRSSGYRDGLEYLDWIRRYALDLGVPIDVVGEVPFAALPTSLVDVRVVAVPSVYESFSMAAVEAMAAGRPVVVGRLVGAAELLTGQQGAGAVVDGRDGDTWAAGLRPYLTDLAHAVETGREGRKLVASMCDPEHVAHERIAYYEQVRTYRRLFARAKGGS